MTWGAAPEQSWLLNAAEAVKTSGKATPWASQDNPGYPSIGFVDWDNPG